MPLIRSIRWEPLRALGCMTAPPGWKALRQTLDIATPALVGRRGPILLASAGSNVLALALPIFILQIYDRVLPGAARATLTALVLGLLVAFACDTALKALRARAATWAAAKL